TINVPPAVTPIISFRELATSALSGRALFRRVLPYCYTSTTGALGSGTNVINITPAVTLVGNVLTVGPTANNVTLPTPPTVSGARSEERRVGKAYSAKLATEYVVDKSLTAAFGYNSTS